MEKKMAKIYESYPWWMVFVVNLIALSIYFAGAYILFTLHWITGTLYIVYLVVLEMSIYRESCTSCCYYGKCCAFSKGALASLFFRKKDTKKFCEKELKFKDFIAQFLVALIPMVIGIALLVSRGFDLWILIATVYPVLSWLVLNPIIYGKMACVHCKQGTICCPALKFFMKKKKK